MAGRLSQTYVSWDDGAVYFLFDVGTDIFYYLQRQVGAGVKHSEYDTLDVQVRIQTFTNQIDRVDQLT